MMASAALDRDYAPLTSVCVRALSDKVYEKRKAAAFEVEKLTRECVGLKNYKEIDKLLGYMGQDFITSFNPNMRKGALVGLAAMAIALGDEIGRYTEDLVNPILVCLSDTDSRVRYYACESLYNVTKVARQNILPLFNEVFSAMSCAITDADLNVRTATEMLLRLTMDIVTEQPDFDVEKFVPVLRERLYSKSTFARSFHLGWLFTLKKLQHGEMLKHLPVILDQLFLILGDETLEIRSRCERLMAEFLEDIRASAKSAGHVIAFDEMINTLINHAESQHVTLQVVAARWIKEFIHLSRRKMLPHVSSILMAVLPNLSIQEDHRRNMTEEQYKCIKELSNSVNRDLMKLVKKCEEGQSGSTHPEAMPNGTLEERQPDGGVAGGDARGHVVVQPKSEELELISLVDVLSKQLQRGRVETKLASLRWLYHLFRITPVKMVQYVDGIFPLLLKTLSDTTDEVVLCNIHVLGQICAPDRFPTTAAVPHQPSTKPSSEVFAATASTTRNNNQHFYTFLYSLLRLFNTDKNLIETKGPYMIRHLCLVLSPEDIYRTLAELILRETNLKFVRQMVESLNTILLTTSELYGLRSRLADLSSQESCDLFTCIYKTWCHSQASTLCLCLWSGCYKHALNLIRFISDQEVTLDLVVELDKLIQLIESPIFSRLRMELLEEDNDDLLKSLQGILMILPQSSSFHLLLNRLTSLRSMDPVRGPKKSGTAASNVKQKGWGWGRSEPRGLDFDHLLQYFVSVQKKHLESKKASEGQGEAIARSLKFLDLSEDEVQDSDAEES